MRRITIVLIGVAIVLSLVCCARVQHDSNLTVGLASNRTICDIMELSLIEGTQSSEKVTFQLHNSTEDFYTYGRAYFIEVLKDGVWYTTDYGQEVVPADSFDLDPGDTVEKTFYVHGDKLLESGTYRVIMELCPKGDSEILYIAGVFTLE